MLQIVNTLVLLALAVATYLPILQIRHWLVRGLDFPRLQILSALCVLALFAFALMLFGQTMSVVWWLVLFFLLANQLWWVWPYSPFHAVQVPQHQSANDGGDKADGVSLLSCNVLMSNRHAQPLLDMIAQHSPDIIAILESDHWWQEQLDTLTDYSHRVACPLSNKYGMHLYSRLELQNARIDYLVEDDVPSISGKVILNSGKFFLLHVIHPKPPAPGENDFSTARDVELLVLAEALKNVDAPIVVTGDLNDVAWSRTTRLFRRVSRLLDPRTGRGLFNTFHADYWFIRWPLDHVFVSTHFRIRNIKRLPHMGSDHFPMLVNLAITAPNLIDEPAQLSEEEKALRKDTMETRLAENSQSHRQEL